MRVLLVDDSPAVLEVLEGLLALEGYHVASAPDGWIALRLARESLPAVVVSDLHMPRMSGLELLTALRSDPVLKSIPVLIMSADTDPALVARALELGAVSYLTKPIIDPEVLFRAIRNALDVAAEY